MSEASQPQPGRYWWIGPRAGDCLGLHGFAPIGSIISRDYGSDTKTALRLTGATLHSVEAQSLRRVRGIDTFDSFVGEVAERAIASATNDAGVVLCFRSIPAIERCFKRHLIASSPWALSNLIDDNLWRFTELSQTGVSLPKSEVVDLTRVSYGDLRRRMGSAFAIKQRRSGAGQGCHFIRQDADLVGRMAELSKDPEVLVSEFVSGPSFNVHGMVLDDETLVSAPSVQLIGIQECDDRAETYCGNDFGAMSGFDDAIHRSIHREAVLIGGWLRSKGYRGVFGVDFVNTGDRIYAVDVNPRFQGSSPLLTQLELLEGRKPFTLLQLTAFGAAPDSVDESWRDSPSRQLARGSEGSQMILRWNGRRGIVTRPVAAGVYRLQPELTFVREGVMLSDCRSADEFLITSGVPEKDLLIEPGVRLLNIVSRSRAVDVSTGKLLDHATEVVTRVKKSLVIEELDPTHP